LAGSPQRVVQPVRLARLLFLTGAGVAAATAGRGGNSGFSRDALPASRSLDLAIVFPAQRRREPAETLIDLAQSLAGLMTA